MKPEINLDVMTTAKFSTIVEQLYDNDDVDIVDAILTACEQTGIDQDLAPRYLNKKLTEIVAEHAKRVNVLT